MLPEDIKRLERERSIGRAKAGPDYSRRDAAIRAVKAQHGKRAAAQSESDAMEYRGYLRMPSRNKLANFKRNDGVTLGAIARAAPILER